MMQLTPLKNGMYAISDNGNETVYTILGAPVTENTVGLSGSEARRIIDKYLATLA